MKINREPHRRRWYQRPTAAVVIEILLEALVIFLTLAALIGAVRVVTEVLK